MFLLVGLITFHTHGRQFVYLITRTDPRAQLSHYRQDAPSVIGRELNSLYCKMEIDAFGTATKSLE
jgi:hypothetical protein